MAQTSTREALDDLRATVKHSITLSAANSRGVSERVGPREFSAYVDAAVEAQLRRDALADTLDRMSAEHGPVQESEVEAIAARLAL